ncbi:MAG: FadR/GntR family transcriptional regulator [Terriglobia bacterium]
MLQRRTLTSQVIDYVLDQIKNGQFAPGKKLPTEKQLMAMLGVSRTCVREAMKALESLGLVRTRPRIGAVVLEASSAAMLSADYFLRQIQTQGADKLLEFRLIVEVGLASLAAERAGPADLDAMERALGQYSEELQSHNTVDCNTDMAFHAALAAASKNSLGEAVWRMISAHLAKVLQANTVVANVYPNTLRDHQKIFHAIQERNPGKARKAMREHLENADWVTRLAICEVSPRAEVATAPP